jgi:hypothetical protein
MVKSTIVPSEPVPPASQLATIPFLAAVDGFLREPQDVPGLRITMHRAVNREGQIYLQQICGYVTREGLEWRGKVGRTFPVSEGIMGAAFANRRIWRTKSFPSLGELRARLREEIARTKDGRDPETVEVSFLAVPFLGPQDEPVLILYADCKELNFFADDVRVRHVVGMCNGFCRLFDWLQGDPFLNLRNFPFQKGEPVRTMPTVYASVQESLDSIKPPKFSSVLSFNYEAAVA